ncbi:DNA-binding domain-containing protein [Corticibacterium sp. UT-5YL-CI-8]|nr:DNA-binding domain-containing protein [Tianweitania sp. UT-5YL-CI-8]
MNHAAFQHDFVAALLDPAAPLPDGVTTARGLPDAKRFAVYRNNVAVALHSALASRFPVTRRIVGEDFFAAMARGFIAREKPASPVIFDYGDGFPGYIATFEPARNLPYLADTAALEALWTRAYHAADTDAIGMLELADAADIASCALVPHPSAALLTSPYPAGSIWQAHQTDSVGAITVRGRETVVVARPGTEVSVHIIPDRDAAFACALFAGLTTQAAAELALRADSGFAFGPALVGLVSLGAFQALSPQESKP